MGLAIESEYGSGLLVILGAGASHDSLANSSAVNVPPLTDGLVTDNALTKEILSKYGPARPIYDYLNRRLRVTNDKSGAQSLEVALSEYRSRASHDPEVSKQLTAFRFYLRDLLYATAEEVQEARGGVSNYLTLTTECINWAKLTGRSVCFVNFNYDPLLEWALASFTDFNPVGWGSYTKGPTYYVVKPHGSVLWHWVAEHIQVANGYAEAKRAIEAGELTENDPHRLTASTRPIFSAPLGDGLSHRAVYPALALPIDGGKSFAWPGAQDELFTVDNPNGTNKSFSRGAFGRVLTIGWRGSEPHFIQRLIPLVTDDALFWFVTYGTDSGTETESNMAALLRPRSMSYVFEAGFSSFLDANVLTQVLTQ